MSKRYHESKEDQKNKKIHGMESFQHENEPYPKSESMQMENILKKEAVHHSSIQLLAYQIYREKGGASLDNWLEAELILRNNYRK
jgi:hypothetical protein